MGAGGGTNQEQAGLRLGALEGSAAGSRAASQGQVHSAAADTELVKGHIKSRQIPTFLTPAQQQKAREEARPGHPQVPEAAECIERFISVELLSDRS